jgi:uncharacterized membrane protein YgcG
MVGSREEFDADIIIEELDRIWPRLALFVVRLSRFEFHDAACALDPTYLNLDDKLEGQARSFSTPSDADSDERDERERSERKEHRRKHTRRRLITPLLQLAAAEELYHEFHFIRVRDTSTTTGAAPALIQNYQKVAHGAGTLEDDLTLLLALSSDQSVQSPHLQSQRASKQQGDEPGALAHDDDPANESSAGISSDLSASAMADPRRRLDAGARAAARGSRAFYQSIGELVKGRLSLVYIFSALTSAHIKLEISAKGAEIRSLKAAHPKGGAEARAAWEPHVKILLSLKRRFEKLTGSAFDPPNKTKRKSRGTRRSRRESRGVHSGGGGGGGGSGGG